MLLPRPASVLTPPISTSRVAEIIGTTHHSQPSLPIFIESFHIDFYIELSTFSVKIFP
jgi:hypothetical protein